VLDAYSLRWAAADFPPVAQRHRSLQIDAEDDVLTLMCIKSASGESCGSIRLNEPVPGAFLLIQINEIKGLLHQSA
jgi:hypothetical protein